MFMGWFESIKSPKLKSKRKADSSTPTGLWKKCSQCGEIVQNDKLSESFQVCPYCDFHFRLSVEDRLDLLLDEGSFQEVNVSLTSKNPLGFVDKRAYDQRLSEAQEKTGMKEGSMVGKGKIDGKDVAIAVMNFRFMGGSMGVVTGEKIAKAMEIAIEENIPAIVVSSSGGARMQEGILSLMQMGKTSAVRQKMKNLGIPYISILTDPTTGGVAASFAMLGDVNIAEPKALIGFAGPRVIEQSIRQKLPEGFQRSEFLLEHGFIDRIVHRHNMKSELKFFIDVFCKDNGKK
jgi:acetyl-CoA carboxylase carboxyl transferase subunit beta